MSPWNPELGPPYASLDVGPPLSRRTFRSEWDEMFYLGAKLDSWLQREGSRSIARRFASRLKRLLHKYDAKEEAIIGQELRSLVRECAGDVHGAIRHTRRQLTLIRKVHAMKDVPRYFRMSRARVLRAERRLRALERRLVARSAGR